MNARPFLKKCFADLFPPETEILHDGHGTVMVILPGAVVTIRAIKGVV